MERTADVFVPKVTEINVSDAFIPCKFTRIKSGTCNSIPCKFIRIMFSDEDFSRNKSPAVQDCLDDEWHNENTYKESSMYVVGVFCDEQGAPIENWLQNSMENLAGHTVSLPTDWTQVAS